MIGTVINLGKIYMDREVVLDGTETFHNCSFYGVTFRADSLEVATKCLGRGNVFDTNCRFPSRSSKP